MQGSDIRRQLIDALRLDLVGPGEIQGRVAITVSSPDEILPQEPSRWYLTGFLVPVDAEASQKGEIEGDDELDQAATPSASDDNTVPEPAAARVRYLPSSLGLSVLASSATSKLTVIARWGDYRRERSEIDGEKSTVWVRQPREETLEVDLPTAADPSKEVKIPRSNGLRVVIAARLVQEMNRECGLPSGTQSLSVFLVNRRSPAPDEKRDEAFAFQVQLEVRSTEPFTPRPNLRSLESDDWDERVADLQYRDACEIAVGHNVATDAVLDEDCHCRIVRTSWIPQAEVERVAPADIRSVELSMDVLAMIPDGSEARTLLHGLVSEYRTWIEKQGAKVPSSPVSRRDTGEELLQRARVAANRIEQGIAALEVPAALEAFRLANRAMALAARRRLGTMREKDPATIHPQWRPFQLAFLLMNLPGIVDPKHDDREVVDLLFFPTGGGKTEAYLGLAAFTLVFRRLTNPGIASAGLTVLMRYTLRLLTLDQLSRASTLICAMELIRQADVEKLGEWPFEIGLWVGRAATPNRMGQKGDKDRESARAKTIAFQNDDRKPSPIPLEECPWCGRKFKAASFQLLPNTDFPTDLRVVCVNRHCDFSRERILPILAVDEPIYRRLPCFMIATVDKFASLPWTGDVGQFFGRVQRHDRNGFYGPCHPAEGHPLPIERLLPPDLIIQDELHLISGPLGTMAGLYETAVDRLSCRELDGKAIRPKIVASTATVRRAEKQIQALFNRRTVDIFPPPGPDQRDSFFAEVHPVTKSNARMYLGIAAQGRSPKVIMLRVYLALLSAAKKLFAADNVKDPQNPADPYMTLLGYFNSLRELGGARRLVEDEVNNRLLGYGLRKRVGETEGSFEDRRIAYEVVELTSRVSTDRISEAKRRLSLPFADKDHVDVALATNMISVGLDITRLGLMVVFGQPKTSSEYIQATSRVGRDDQRPGLVVTVLNVHRHRDRSHYERFGAYHQTFYRNVEATSVTPFSPRALDRGLAGTLVALVRQGHLPMNSPLGATAILEERGRLDFAIRALVDRAVEHADLDAIEATTLRERVRTRIQDLLDEWSRIAKEYQQVGGKLQYNPSEAGGAKQLLYDFLSPELKELPARHAKFRANRSLRDVEASVNLWMKTMDGAEVEGIDE